MNTCTVDEEYARMWDKKFRPTLPPTLYAIAYGDHDGHHAPLTNATIYTSEDAALEFLWDFGRESYSDGTLITYNIVEYMLPPF